ncbi:pdhC [Symbiodinium microadriaticum]|nr:pdhC [Symbiodinium microadriaticum]
MAFPDTLAIEQFDYSTGALHLSNGGSGWFREWRTQNEILTGYEIIDTDPLIFPNLVTTGNYCSGGIAWTTAGRFFDPAAFPGYIDGNGRIGVGSFYFSFLIRKENADVTPVQIVFADAAGAEWAINEELIKIGYLGDTYGGQYWGVSVFNDDDVALSDSLIRVGETYRMVCEITFGVLSTVNIWVNPDLNSLNPVPDASVNTTNDIAFWNLVLSFVDGGSEEGSFDEFVFTDDIGNVLPVEYLVFSAEMEGRDANIKWSTATEITNDRFVVQHSIDGISWDDLGIIRGQVIKMPKMSDTMEEGVIASWLKKEGDEISSGDILAEVETDKATMELESYNDGTLLYVGVKEKDTVPVDGVIAIIGEKGEDISDLLKSVEQGGDANGSAGEAQAPEPPATESGEAVDTSDIKATVVRMPKMSDTMEEGVIASWLKKVGDDVSAGDILAEVETDKATMELESYEDGNLLYTAVEAGNAVAVDGVIAIIGEKGADYETLLKAEQNGGGKKEEAPAISAPAAPAPAAASSAPVAQPAPTTTSTTSNGRLKASPLAKKLASEKGIDLTMVQGSGDGGRIVKKDIENFVPPATAPQTASSADKAAPSFNIPTVVGEEGSEDVPLSQMRKAIAKRLSESKFTAPHFYVTMEINMDKAIAARKSMNEISPVKISFNDFVLKGVAAALRQHPDVNVTWAEDKLVRHQHIHIGVAVAIPDGLIVPVVRFADSKSMAHISAEVKELAQKAHDKKLQPEEFSGNTFTVSNLGMFGVEEFTAIINPPDACILAVGGIKETVVVKNGEMKPGNVMKVTLSSDHRAVDGAVGAAFLKTLKDLLEDPVRLLI